MRRVLIGGLLLSSFLFGDCSQSEEMEAKRIFNQALFENDFSKKIGLLIGSKNICSFPLAEVELQYLKVDNDLAILERNSNKLNLKKEKLELVKLSNLNDALDSKYYSYKSKMREKIKTLFMRYHSIAGEIVEDRTLANNDVYKNLLKPRGTYTSHITFNYNSSKIRDRREAKKIKNAILAILRKNPNARFSITGHSSSEGSYWYNKRLSQKRAESLERFIGKVGYISVFSKGESELICIDGRLPYRDRDNNYHCKGGEDKRASRRVVLKRID